MNSRIKFVIIGVCVAAIVIILIAQNLSKPTQPNDEQQYITKGSIITSTNSSELSENYTSTQLLIYCTSNESQVYNDVCVRGLWDVSDQCKNENFSSTNPICNDPRFAQFENKVDKVMLDLDKSLTQIIDSCMITKNNDDIQSCLVTIERIKNDCTDPHFYSLTHICVDSRLDQFTKQYNENSKS